MRVLFENRYDCEILEGDLNEIIERSIHTYEANETDMNMGVILEDDLDLLLLSS